MPTTKQSPRSVLIPLALIAKQARVPAKLARQRLRRAIDTGTKVPSVARKETRWEFTRADAAKIASLITRS